MTTLALPDTGKLDKESNAIVATANHLEVSDNDDLLLAGALLKRIKLAKSILGETFDGPIKDAHLAHKSIKAAKTLHEKPLADAERIVKGKMGSYTQEQERIRQEEERRLREIARKEAEERQLAEAARLEAAGETEAAEAVIDAPPTPAPVVVPKTVAKVEGVSYRTTWKFNIVNADAIPRAYMVPDEKAIGAHARSMKERACIPGVEFIHEKSVAARF